MAPQRIITAAELQQRMNSQLPPLQPSAEPEVPAAAYGAARTYPDQPVQPPARPEQQERTHEDDFFDSWTESDPQVASQPPRTPGRHRGAWIAGGTAVVLAGAAALTVKYAPIHFGDESHAAAVGPLPTQVHKKPAKAKAATTAPATAASTASSASTQPLPAKAADYKPAPIDCAPITTIAVDETIPMLQSVQLLGDKTRYNFSAGPRADFVAQVSGTISVMACLNKPDVLTSNAQVKDQPGSKTYSIKFADIPTHPDTTKLQIVPTWRDPQVVLADLCKANGGVFLKNGKLDTAHTPAPVPEACQEYTAYTPGHNTEYLNEIQNNFLSKEKVDVATAATALTLQLIDKQDADSLAQAEEAYVRNAFTEQAAAQAKQQQGDDPDHKYTAPQLNIDFSGDMPSLSGPYIEKNKTIKSALLSTLTSGLQQEIQDYQKAHPDDKKLLAALKAQPLKDMDATDLLKLVAETLPNAQPSPFPFGLDDSTSDFTPSLTLKN